MKFSILINRTFKYYCYKLHIPARCNVIDMGCGNGGDLETWKELSYTVLAVEIDPQRINILSQRLSGHSQVVVLHCDMVDAYKYITPYYTMYRIAAFMRSISHLSLEEIATMLKQLLRLGVEKFVVVTAVSDYCTSYLYKDTDNNLFRIDKTDNNLCTTSVTYVVDGKAVTYTDNCYTLSQWSCLATRLGLTMDLHTQRDFVMQTYGLSENLSVRNCFTDVCMVLSVSV